MSIEFYRKSEGKLTKSSATYFEYPGGESSIKFDKGDLSGTEIAFVRGAEAIDLIRLAMWSDAVWGDGGVPSVLIPYFPGARADRGNPLGVQVYGEILSEVVSPNQVIAYDIHSDKAQRYIGDSEFFVSVPSANLIRTSLGLATFHHAEHDDYRAKFSEIEPIVGVISPDRGAKERASAAATALGVNLYHAEKHRDFKTGKLSGFSCEPLPDRGSLLVVDDICDGGGTFLGLADATGLPRQRLALWVSHGIFSAGLSSLAKYYGKIVTTDSHPGATSTIDKDPYGPEPNIGALKTLTVLPILYHLAEYVKETK